MSSQEQQGTEDLLDVQGLRTAREQSQTLGTMLSSRGGEQAQMPTRFAGAVNQASPGPQEASQPSRLNGLCSHQESPAINTSGQGKRGSAKTETFQNLKDRL